MSVLLRGTTLPILGRAAPGPMPYQWIAHFHSTPGQYAKRSSGQRQKKPSSVAPSSRKLAKDISPTDKFSDGGSARQPRMRHGKGSSLSAEPSTSPASSSRNQFVRDAAPHGPERDLELKRSQMRSRPVRRRVEDIRRVVRTKRESVIPSRGTYGSSAKTASSTSRGPPATPRLATDIPPLTDSCNAPVPPIPQKPNLQLPGQFMSPPLMPGLLESVRDVLGHTARPTSIQSLSLKHLFNTKGQVVGTGGAWKQFLLASETGSGKSIAYLLPLLQGLKQSELDPELCPPPPTQTNTPKRTLNPRGIIIAPTHELSRQLSSFAKSLLHNIKLRVLCASRANITNEDGAKSARSSSKMAKKFAAADGEGWVNGREARKEVDVDVVVGTPNKLMEMARGWRWADGQGDSAVRRWKAEPEMGLGKVEWVVVDEGDVLFDPDFIDTTKLLLGDISASRGRPIQSMPSSSTLPATSSPDVKVNSVPDTSTDLPVLALPHPPSSTKKFQPADYPFNLLLTTATVPSSLAAYLDAHHPRMTRLASPGLHKLPHGLVTEYVEWSGASRWSDVEKRVRQVWAEEAAVGGGGEGGRSKMLIFCNKGTTVETLGEYLHGKGLKNIALTSRGTARQKGNNHHLDGFLKPQRSSSSSTISSPSSPAADTDPHILVTTSLLSRGLDFSPSVRHVLIPEPPRNLIDFLHRAGRSGRACEWGRVLVFVKTKGRGSKRGKDVQKAVGGLRRRGRFMASHDDERLGLGMGWDGGPAWDEEGSDRGREFANGRDGRKVHLPESVHSNAESPLIL